MNPALVPLNVSPSAPNLNMPPSLSSDGALLPLSPRGNQTFQDVIRLRDRVARMAHVPPSEILAKVIVGGWQSGHSFTNGFVTYVTNDHSVNLDEPTFYGDQTYAANFLRRYFLSAGQWIICKTGEPGFGIISLICRVQGCGPESAYIWFARACGLSIDDCGVSQMGQEAHDVFVECPSLYSTPLAHAHPVLGTPRTWTWFTTELGQNSVGYGVWVVNSQPVGLFCSMVFDAKSRQPKWKFVRPPACAMLFNRHRLHSEASLPVLICDSLELAAEHQTSPEFVATWAGGTEYVSEIDWPSLAGRDVTFVTSADQGDTYVVGAELRTIFNRLGTTLECCEA